MLTRAKIIPYCAPHTLAHIRESPPPHPPTASKHTEIEQSRPQAYAPLRVTNSPATITLISIMLISNFDGEVKKIVLFTAEP